jgi:hypothetical protein
MKKLPIGVLPLVFALILLITGVILYNGQSTVKTPVSAITKQKSKQITLNKTESQAVAAAQSTQPEQTQPAANKPANDSSASSKTAPKQNTPAPDSPYGPRCSNLLNQYYSAYQTDIANEKANHQGILNDLKWHYDHGDYNVGYPPGSAEPYNDYQSDIQDENARWNQATAAIQQGYNDRLRAAGCAYNI